MIRPIAFTVAVCIPAALFGNQGFIDQSFEDYGGYASVGNEWRQAQTFTVGSPGRIFRVDAALRPGDTDDLSSDATVELSLVRTINGLPSLEPNNVLATAVATFPAPDLEYLDGLLPGSRHAFQWVEFDFEPLPIAAGELLAIVLHSSEPHGYQWATNFQVDYSGGQGLWGPPAFDEHTGDPRDYLFRTHVIPEPQAFVSGVICLLCCIGLRHRIFVD